MFATLGRRTALHAARRTAQQQAKRRMGGGAAAPEWTGIDKVVRGYFPKDEDSEFSCIFRRLYQVFIWFGMLLCRK